jgi:formylglycine-generating enzyme required for sulfatase activity
MYYFASFALVFFILQYAIDGFRWQLTLAYLISLMLFLLSIPKILKRKSGIDEVKPKRRSLVHVSGVVIGIILLTMVLIVRLFTLDHVPVLNPDSYEVITKVREKDGMVMVYVPAGEFKMGSWGDNWIRKTESPKEIEWKNSGLYIFPDEIPGRKVYLDAYWIDQTEVTVAMFRKFIQETGYVTTAERDGWGKCWTPGPKEEEWEKVPGADWEHPYGPDSSAEDDHPVTQVSWEDALAYAEWVGGKLPTEAQWEKAARGTDGRYWPWGIVFDGNLVNSCDLSCKIERWKDERTDDGFAFTSPAGSFPGGASPYGALDMSGNVWEWTRDWYEKYYYWRAPDKNPTGPESGSLRSMRGGAWYDTDVWMTCTVRHQNPARDRYTDLGFRCVLIEKK